MWLGAAAADSLGSPYALTCSCWSPKAGGPVVDDASTSHGQEREMRIMYQQPHLVPPMKLTVFDELPSTPTHSPPSQLSQWLAHGKASLRASLSTHTPVSSRPLISGPLAPCPATPCRPSPSRRPPGQFRPLELSIYLPQHRLSDLPQFDRMSFTDGGEIKAPLRAVTRAKSEEYPVHKLPMLPAVAKPASMIEQPSRARHDPETSSITLMPNSRPPSEMDALRSHPVSWASLSGPPAPHHLPGCADPSVAILTPMQEEFTPTTPSLSPSSHGQAAAAAASPTPHLDLVFPASVVRNFSKPTEAPPLTGYSDSHHQQNAHRVSQWLAHRDHSSSMSSLKSLSTSSSFAEHRWKRSQSGHAAAGNPGPLILLPLRHQRTMTDSTVVSTIETNRSSIDDQSRTDVSSASSVDLHSRSGTVKNVSTTLRPILSGVPDLPPAYDDLVKHADEPMIREIRGPLRSPGVGVAF